MENINHERQEKDGFTANENWEIVCTCMLKKKNFSGCHLANGLCRFARSILQEKCISLCQLVIEAVPQSLLAIRILLRCCLYMFVGPLRFEFREFALGTAVWANAPPFQRARPAVSDDAL